MSACEESWSREDLDAVVIHSPVDAWKANSLIDELKHQDRSIAVVAANSDEADLDAALHRLRRRTWIIYLSPRQPAALCKSTVLRYALDERRDAVVVIVDNHATETPPSELANFLCFRYVNRRVEELCRELALLIKTPPLPRRPKDVTGYAVAFRVLNGYLRLILPKFHERLKGLYPTVQAKCVKKLLIICPESCRPPMMTEVSIKPAKEHVLRNATRAGQRYRDYSAPVYCITDNERSCEYYFPAVFDHSLVSLSDIQRSGLAGVDDSRMRRIRNSYILHLQQLLQRREESQCRILYWRDSEVSLANFLLPVIREEIDCKPDDERVEMFKLPTDFEYVDGPGVNPASLYANPAGCYKLDSDPKGICLIINVAEFESSATTESVVSRILCPRTGTEADVRELASVFQWLKFEVQVHVNVNKSDLLRIINDIRELDHGAYDAFVCCLMSHGYLGHIFTADCQPLGILEDIARAFYPESCPTLAGKPKIFLVQSCQISGMHSPAYETNALESDADKCAALDNKKRTLLLPDAPDFFMSYSTLPRNLSFRDQERGSFYVQALIEVLKQGLELQTSLYEVAQRVEQQAAGSGVEGQRPFCYVSTDHKSVFLCGPRCKTTDDRPVVDRSRTADEQRQFGQNPTSESPGEQDPANLSRSVANGDFGNSPLMSDHLETNSSRGHYEMTIAGIAPNPKDPFDFHVYVGFSRKNYAAIKSIIDTLQTKWHLLCCLPCNSHITQNMKDEAELIKYSVARSEKCLLYVTPQYTREPCYQVEIKAAVKKARRLSGDMVFVLKDPQLSAASLSALQEFPGLTDWTSVDRSALLNKLDSWLSRDTKLAPITQMPEKISGYYEALAYYYAFLNIVLHDHRQKMKSVVESWSEDARSGVRVFLPMLIVVPKSCRAPKSFHVEGKLMTTSEYVPNTVDRASNAKRDYKLSVVKLIVDAEKNQVVYFSGEFPACLLTVYETYMSGQTGMDRSQLDNICTDFCDTLQSLLCHADNRHCIGQYRLVQWSDDSDDLYDFLLGILNSVVEEEDASTLVVCSPRKVGSQLPERSYNLLESSNNLLTGGSQSYAMSDVRPRGICLVINISDVTATSVVDVRLLFEQFHFRVRVHNGQMTSDQLDSLLCDVAHEDHSRCDAFVCYIASGGRLDSVRTSDGVSNSTVNLVNIFNDTNCVNLRGKPKLFLIHTTDDGTAEDSVSDDIETAVQSRASSPTCSTSGQSLQHDSVSSPPPDQHAETLVPSVKDVLVSLAWLPASAADRCASVYATALKEHLRPGRDVKEALNTVNQQFEDRVSQFSPRAKTVVVPTLDRPLVFPHR